MEAAKFAAASDNEPSRTSVLGSIYFELSQSGDTPPWSKDTWSFAPINLGQIKREAASFGVETDSIGGRSSNITFQTPATNARLECKEVATWTNTSTWLETVDFTNKTSWNDMNRPTGLDRGYLLKGFANVGPAIGFFMSPI